MTSEPDWERVEELFHAALDLASVEQEEYLARECAGDPALLAEVRELLSADNDAETFLGEEDRGAIAAPLVAGELPRPLGAYRLLEVIGAGGMGLVYGAERADGSYDARIAVKMLRPGLATEGLLARFDAERRTLARLQHPGIARLLDAGEEEDGSPWLAMELVDGRPIDEWCDARRAGLRARVDLVARVCDAVAHAHDQLVVHRDLKPQNVLVDTGGAPRLLDFGIAKVLRGEDGEDLGLSLTATSERALTPSYAAPEQVRGEPVGVRTDVYALGVLLFELLAGRRPYRDEGTSRGELERAILEEEVAGPSAAVARTGDADELAALRSTDPRRLRRDLAGDLDRICLTALRKEPERRYPSAVELGDELRRWLAHLPVRARGDSFFYRTSKLVRRRPIETALAGLLLLLGLASSIAFVRASLRDAEYLAEIGRLGDFEELAELRAEADALWPAHPERVAAIEGWLERARALRARSELHTRTLERWRAQEDGAGFGRWGAKRLEELVLEVERLGDDDPYGPTVAALERRLDRARTIRARSIDDRREEWEACLARLEADGRFADLARAPQLGLVPLGPDAESGLEAFWAIETGAEPQRDYEGRLRPSPDGGLVLLLLPGGRVTIGAQSDDPGAFRHDAEAESDEGPPHEVELVPFLLSKFEVTQGQWVLWTGANPSDYQEGSRVGERQFGPTNPVEQVSQQRGRLVLGRLDLDLPTEVQWEHAARAGTDTVWATGPEASSLAGHVNIADVYARGHGGSDGWSYSDWIDDGHTVHAPVGQYEPNPFGLYDVLGNVWEWTRDRYHQYDAAEARPGDGLRGAGVELPEGHDIVARGGGFGNPPGYLRSASRYPARPTLESRSTGLRPARAWRAADPGKE